MILTEHPRPSHTFVHLSDTHLPAERTPLYGGADADGNLSLLLERLVDSGLRPDALLLTGDLTDKGDRTAYRRLRGLVGEAASTLGCPVVWAAGNHDDRAAFRAELLDGDGDEPIVSVDWFGGLRVIALDSTVPGAHWGEIDDEQLAWLRGELATPAPAGSILLIHHPPLPTVLDLAVTVELRGQARLADAIAGTDVRAILSGHMHHPSFGTFAGIPVAVASSSAYGQDLAQPPGATRGQDATQGYNLVHVYRDTIVHSAVGLERGSDVGEPVAPEEAQRRITGAGIGWRD
ncbi:MULTISPECIES: metallophosphoesterase [Microbacterium]|uniref:metallophosphoesterase n=1 Tax=Microbacterium TaxID=33882 RepID=UPI00217E47A4|nr:MULTISPECIES: metallophosphoesterase [Microbacterium]UWF77612.1 metallophosphoesterase [Microbacterium neungamense]WCM55783.1 metallophosphoesterase [Microbacterium sp. EF45047]